MKKKLLVLLCIVALAAFALASCDIFVQINPPVDDNGGDNTDTDPGTDNGGDTTEDDCVHTFSEAWARNSTQHWHAATCEHSEQKSELASHTDEDQDGLCDVCGYNVGHTHTYEEAWTTNELAHWHNATCKHTNSQGDYALHVDENANGECDVCGADVTVEIEEDNYGLIIEAILAARGGVSSGAVMENSMFISLGDDGLATRSSLFEYTFGANSAYFKSTNEAYNKDKNGVETTATSTWEKWQEMLGAENVFGVFKEDDSDVALDAAADIDTISGYYFAVSTLANEYGPENILYALYTLANDSSASDLIWEKDEETGALSFVFNYLQVNEDVAAGEDPNVNYYEVGVGFAYNENYVLTALVIVCDCYTNSLTDERDHDYTYDPVTGTIKMKPEGEYAADTYTFIVSQVPGERTYVNENPRSKFLPESFELFTDNKLTTPAPETITVEKDKVFILYLGSFLPEGTSITFDPDALSATIDIDGVVYTSDGGVGLYNEVIYFSHTALGVAPEIICKICTPGTFDLTVSIGTENTRTVTVVVTDASSGGGDSENTTTIDVTVTDVYDTGTSADWAIVANNPDYTVSFTATETGYYTFVIPMGLAAYDKIAYDTTFGTPNAVKPWVELSEWEARAGVFTVYIEAGETYEFYVATYSLNTTTFTIAITYSAE